MKLSKKNILFISIVALGFATHACIPFAGGSASSLLDVALQGSTPISDEQATTAVQQYCGDHGQALVSKLGRNAEVHFQAGYTQDFDNVGASYGLALDSAGKLLRSGQYNEYSRSSQLMLPPHEEFDHGELVRAACIVLQNTLSKNGKGYPRYEAVQANVSGTLAHGRANLGSCVGIAAANPESNTEATIMFCENGMMQRAEESGAGVGNKSAIIMQTKN